MARQRGWAIVGTTAVVSASLASFRGVTAHAGSKASVEFSVVPSDLAKAACAGVLETDGTCAFGNDGLPVAPVPDPQSLLYPLELDDGSVLLVREFLDRGPPRASISAKGPREALSLRCDATLLRRVENIRARTQRSESFAPVGTAWLASLGDCEVR